MQTFLEIDPGLPVQKLASFSDICAATKLVTLKGRSSQEGSEMYDDINALTKHRFQRCLVQNIAVNEADRGMNIATAAGGFVIEGNDLITEFDQSITHVATDKAGAASDQDAACGVIIGMCWHVLSHSYFPPHAKLRVGLLSLQHNLRRKARKSIAKQICQTQHPEEETPCYPSLSV